MNHKEWKSATSVPVSDLEAALIAVLERKPQAAIPEGFAARVCAELPAGRRYQSPPHIARTVGYASLSFLLAALAILTIVAPRSLQPSAGFGFVIEAILVLQMSAIALWLGVQREV
jgi:hypothetical protein